MYRVEIKTLGGASGTIVADCPTFDAAIILADAVRLSCLRYQSMKIIDHQDTVCREWRKP